MKNIANLTGLFAVARSLASKAKFAMRGLLILSVLFNALAMPSQIPAVNAAGNACVSGSPGGGGYTVTVCINTPADSAVVSGEQTVLATYSVVGTNPGVAKFAFYLDGGYLLIDYQTPYTFILPTNKWVDGTRVLEAEAIMRDGYTSPRASINLTFQNNISVPPVNTNTFTPTSGTTPQPGKPFVLATTGDGADGANYSDLVTDVIQTWNPNMFLYLGDVYGKGTQTEYLNWYGSDTTFYGRFRTITNPIVGNHEYENGVAPGYFDYWDNVPSYYSYDAAGWHFIALNSNCGLLKDCAAGQAQYQWLQNDLITHTNACTIAYFHHPVYNTGPEGYETDMNDIWALLAQNGVDLVFAGHDHTYQRWMPLNASGSPDPGGVTSFVVGTGGHGVQNFVVTDNRMVFGSEVSPFSFGALRLQLNQEGASYQYINYQGLPLDSGAIRCSGVQGTDSTPPSQPENLTASVYSATQADLSWVDSVDSTAVAGYDIYRDGVLQTSIGPVNTYRDSNLSMGASYSYQVMARDLAGNTSPISNSASVSMPSVLFKDGFETGNLSAWTTNSNLVVQQDERFAGLFAARAYSPAGAPILTNALKTLAATETSLYFSTSFKINSLGTTSSYLQRFRNASNGSILGVFVSGSTRKLGYRNDVGAVNNTAGPVISLNTWHELQTHVQINGTSSLVEIWLDGSPVAALTRTESLGTNPVGRVQLGDSSGTAVHDIIFDEVAYNASYIDTGDIQPPSVPTGLAGSASVTSVNLGWDAASDDVGVTGYDLFRNGALLAELGAVTTYEDTAIAPAITYQYQVRARDAAGNLSALSPQVAVTTPADTNPPSVVLTTPADGLTVSGSIMLSADASDNLGVQHVDFLVNGVVVSSQLESPYTYLWNTTSMPDGSLAVITARAVDTSLNETISAPVSVTVNNSAGDVLPPGVPGNFSAAAAGASRVDLTWSAASDNIGVTAYDLYRDAVFLAQVTGTNFSDTTVLAGDTHVYAVQARDAAGNLSAQVSAPALTVPAVLFSDGFESGDLAQWVNSGLVNERQTILEGANAARAAASGSGAVYAYKNLSLAQPELYYRAWFNIRSQGGTSAYLQRFRTSTGAALLGVYVSSTGKLSFRNDVTGVTSTSTATVSQGTWHELQTRLLVNGVNSQVDIWLDGVQIGALSKTEDFGTNPIGRIQLGDNSASAVFDLIYDEISADSTPLREPALPYTTIENGPQGAINTATANFNFWTNASAGTFECALDGAAYSACVSPLQLTGLANGSHTLSVRALDSASTPDASPVSRSWIVDMIPPTVTALSPLNAAVDVAVDAPVIATFSEPIDLASLSAANFYLLPQGSSTPLPAALSYDAASNTASLLPSASLNNSSTYIATLKGGQGGLTDLDGNPLAADVSWSFTTIAFSEGIPPSVSLTSPAGGAALSGTVTLTADASDASGISLVEFLAGGTLIGSDSSAPYSLDWNTLSVTNGAFALSARAVDTFSNQAVSTPVSVTVFNDTTPPSIPVNLAVSGTPTATQISLTWSASTDDGVVSGYDLLRNGVPLVSLAAVTAYNDTSVSPGSTYQYQVRARDAAGNLSNYSAVLQVSTPSLPATLTFLPVADSYVTVSKPSTNYGRNTSLRLDASPDMLSFLRFNVSGLAGRTITRVRLQVFTSNKATAGVIVNSVADNSWGETTIKYNNMPPMGSQLAFGSAPAGTWITVDINAYINGDGSYSFGLDTPGSTSINLASRESGANAPRLIIDLQ